jgi:hypothetical protein
MDGSRETTKGGLLATGGLWRVVLADVQSIAYLAAASWTATGSDAAPAMAAQPHSPQD